MVKLTRNLWKIKALLYKDNITQYLTEFQDLNNIVRLGGQAIKKIITQAILKKLIKLIYSYYGTVSLNDLKFITVMQDTGLTYKFLIL